MKAPRLLTITLAAITVFQSPCIGAEKSPEGEFRKPRAGDEVLQPFNLEGRTRNIPDGWSVFLFSQEDKSRQSDGLSPGLFPHGPIQANRRFEYPRMVGKTPGKTWFYLYALPPGRDEFIANWKKKFTDYLKRFGTSRGVYPKREEIFEGAVFLAELEVTILEPKKK